jgi:thiosulfate reductase cytochrome b subunit
MAELRHSAVVRVTHWITALCFAALLLSGVEILISHPRFYWGETGNASSPALFQIPIPASRAKVQTGYGFVLPDQNGWSRYLHFQSAWVVVFTGILYYVHGLVKGRFRREGYNRLQRATYRFVVFVLFPLMIWTGLAMSPAIASVFPAVVTVLGGQQSARTIHFFLMLLLVVFVTGHVIMAIRTRRII